MIDSNVGRIDTDTVGAFVAALCGVHCLVTPLILLALPALPLGEPLEWCLLTCSTLLACYTSWRANRKHGSWHTAMFMGLGLTVLLTPHLLGWPEDTQVIMSAIGASFLITGHVLNCRRGLGSCVCEPVLPSAGSDPRVV